MQTFSYSNTNHMSGFLPMPTFHACFSSLWENKPSIHSRSIRNDLEVTVLTRTVATRGLILYKNEDRLIYCSKSRICVDKQFHNAPKKGLAVSTLITLFSWVWKVDGPRNLSDNKLGYYSYSLTNRFNLITHVKHCHWILLEWNSR